MGMSI
jgi:hypothetical protein